MLNLNTYTSYIDTPSCRRLMLVDDEPSILKSAFRCLNDPDYIIDQYPCPKEALKAAEHTAYDLIISDQRMPSILGTELLAEIRLIQPNAVGIILSGYCDSQALIDAINCAHIYKFISKPWNDDEFKQLVSEALDYGAQQLETLQLADKARVSSGSMTKHRAYLRDLETRYPGITKVDRDEHGAIVLGHKRLQ